MRGVVLFYNVTKETDKINKNKLYYKMEVVKPVPCSPSKTMVSSSFSNLSSNDPYLSSESHSYINSNVKIFPNPTKGMIKILSDRVVEPIAVSTNPLISPLAIVIIRGLISSTLLSRIITPVIYKLLPPKI